MNIGDYVRTKNKGVKKIIALYSNAIFDGQSRIEENQINKSSSNIIDLIEVGDYVNGMKVFEVMKNPETDDIKEHLIVFVNEIKNELYTIYGNEIKSIVTHEQFESMEYKL